MPGSFERCADPPHDPALQAGRTEIAVRSRHVTEGRLVPGALACPTKLVKKNNPLHMQASTASQCVFLVSGAIDENSCDAAGLGHGAWTGRGRDGGQDERGATHSGLHRVGG